MIEAQNNNSVQEQDGNSTKPLLCDGFLPEGFKVYVCTDCQTVNIKKDNRKIRVGFCDKCEHPLWNMDTDER